MTIQARTITIVVLILAFVYGIMEAFPLLRGPHLVITSPKDMSAVSLGQVELSGRAFNTETLFVNDSTLLIDTKGMFSTELVLPKGGTILTLKATDRFGRTRTETRTLYSL